MVGLTEDGTVLTVDCSYTPDRSVGGTRMIRIGIAASMLVLVSWQCATAQSWGGRPPESTGRGGGIRSTLSSEQLNKTSSVILDMIDAMVERRMTETTEPSDWSSLSTELVRVNPAGELQVYVLLDEMRQDYMAQL